MIIIIDGYNLIKQIAGKPHVSNVERDKFVNQIAQYLRKQKFDGIIVFDGGATSHPYRLNYQGITVIFSGYKEKADHVIMRLIDEHKNQELLVVSSDREIRNYAQERKKTSLAASDFYHQILQKKPEQPVPIETSLHKTAINSPPELDQLMEEASREIPAKEDDQQESRKRPAQRTSKKERIANRVLRKL